MRRRRRKIDVGTQELNMTAMIDVVFQLLIFFITTAPTPESVTHLNFNRGGDTPSETQTAAPVPAARINIYQEGYTLNDTVESPNDLARKLGRLSAVSKSDQILILSSLNARHEQLVQVLDMCEMHGLTNLSIMSTE